MRIDRLSKASGTGGSDMVAPHGGLSFLPANVAEVPADTLKTFAHTKKVGNYLLGRTLGEGSFAKVKEGLHTLTGEKVAVKVIDKKKAREDAYVRKNLRREGKLLQMVHHRNIVRLFEIMETENSYYLVTELCSGGDLMEHICNRKRLDEKESRKYIRQMLSAVGFLHKSGILHRDLKVENLLLDENKDIKIIDFGLSNAVEVSHTSEGETLFHEFCVTQCGSPAYAAPELLGNNKYGPKVDIWSIGVNMYAMLTGSLPFTVEPFNIKALHKKMLRGDINPLPDLVTKNCRDLLKGFLNPDPERRITIEEAMKHPWICEGYRKPVEAAPFPNKMTREDMVHDILKHMSHYFDMRPAEVTRLVVGNVPNSATATYCLLAQRLIRHHAQAQHLARIQKAANDTNMERVGSPFDVTGIDVIELLPVNNREGTVRESPKAFVDVPSQETKVLEMNMVPRRLPKDPDPKTCRKSRLRNPRSRTQQQDSVDYSPGRGSPHHGRQDSMDHSPGRGSPRHGHQDSVVYSPGRGSPRRGRQDSIEHSPGRSSPRRGRQDSIDHSPGRSSPRRGLQGRRRSTDTSPRRATNRRGSVGQGVQKRGLLLPRSQSQDTDGSGAGLPDITLRDLEVDNVHADQSSADHAGQSSENGQLIHVPHEGLRTIEKPDLQKTTPKQRVTLVRDTANLPAVNARNRLQRPRDGPPSDHMTNRQSSVDYTASPELGRRANHLSVDTEHGRQSPNNYLAKNNNINREYMGRLSPCWSCKTSANAKNLHAHSLESEPKAVHSSSHSTTSSIGRYSVLSNPAATQNSSLKPTNDQTAMNSDPMTRGEWRSAHTTRPSSNVNNNYNNIMTNSTKPHDSMPKKLVIDSGHYDRYARATGRIHTIASADVEGVYVGAHRRLINLMYPSQQQRPRHVTQRKPQQPRSVQGNGQNGDNFLGVTGERSHVTNRGPLGMARHSIQNPSISARSNEAVEELLVEMPQDCRSAMSPVNRMGSRSPSPAYLKGSQASHKVALPAISPPLVNHGNTSKMHIEDLDK